MSGSANRAWVMRRPRGLGPAPLPAISDPAAQPTFARAHASPPCWRSTSSIRPGGNPVSSADTGHALPTSQGEAAPARPRTRATSHSGGRAAPPTAVWRPRPRKGAREALGKIEGKQAGSLLTACDENISRLQGAALTTKQELAHSSGPAGLAQARRRVDGHTLMLCYRVDQTGPFVQTGHKTGYTPFSAKSGLFSWRRRSPLDARLGRGVRDSEGGWVTQPRLVEPVCRCRGVHTCQHAERPISA